MKLYAVTGPPSGGDRYAVLVAETGEVIWSHVSSSKQWALNDVTRSFGRDVELASRYPDGYEVVELTGWSEAPAEVREANDRWAEARHD